ncbi:Vegetative incompatibility protein HET-E-1 [Cyphellophora attinorum]|uniref:Vegetative incompatibility protein HET-E-1 n=1 Tax=Cyphellophora attinorum TaxID=1664694 RepID=A0A0N0NRP6_9EURO|nr:Vegetative incompatibility protein HET-E-1 [Phialophora attinorum]KPI45079.1 Vegetative incompatibility protein HET-E-1 [Phialophora attinorum]
MRLIKVHPNGALELTDVDRHNVPQYAILSHTWESSSQELSIQDIRNGTGTEKHGYRKLTFCAQRALQDGLQYFWIDSVCIDRSNSTELAEAINSMFRWYRGANVCYVYLTDVHGDKLDEPAFRQSRHHTRGWTLQEIIAPSNVEFFSSSGHKLGDKVSLESQLHEITGIATEALRSPDAETTIEEDQVYCLLGIFGVYLPLIYGEGKSHALRRLRNEINAFSRDPQALGTLSVVEQARACLSSIEYIDQSRELRSILSRSKDSCHWVLKNTEYASWFEAKQSSKLWITAKAGHGKTTLAAHIYENLSQQHRSLASNGLTIANRTIVLFFLFQRSNNETTSLAAAALTNLVWQLAKQAPVALEVLSTRHALLSRRGKFDWSVGQLSDVLSDMLKALGSGSVIYIVIDAFDEATIESRESVIEWVHHNTVPYLNDPWHFEHTGPIVKVLMTSRPDGEMLDHASNFARLDIKHSDTADDMNSLIQTRVADLAGRRRLSIEVVHRITQFLGTRAHGMFIWVILILKELEQRNERLTDEVVATKLSKIPAHLNDTYTLMLDSGSQARGNDMWRILRWLMFATRVLNLRELHDGMCLETGTDAWHDFRGDLEYMCGSLVQISGGNELVTFVHPTARDFIHSLTIETEHPVFHDVSMDYCAAHDHLAQICLQHFIQNGCLRKLVEQLWTSKPYAERMQIVYQHLAHECSFCRYAASAWYQHLQAAETPSAPLADTVLSLMEDRWSRDGLMILKFYSEGRSWGPGSQQTTLHLAAYFNQPWLARQYIERNADAVNGTTYLYITPIVFAAEMGGTDVVRILLEAGADPDAFEKDGWSALHWAARNGCTAIVELLLDHGAQCNPQDAKGYTPLEWAIDREHWDAAARLIVAEGPVNPQVHQTYNLELYKIESRQELRRLERDLIRKHSKSCKHRLRDSRLDIVDNLGVAIDEDLGRLQQPPRSTTPGDHRANKYAAMSECSPSHPEIVKHHDRNQWEAQRQAFTSYYLTEKRTLNEVISIMRDHHNFSASPRQWKSRLHSWGLNKYVRRNRRQESFEIEARDPVEVVQSGLRPEQPPESPIADQ